MATKKSTSADSRKAKQNNSQSHQISESARETVLRSAASAKQNVKKLHERSSKFNSAVEDSLKHGIDGYASIMNSMTDAAFANINHALTTVEKLAGAENISQVVEIQADFVRESTSENFERAKETADKVREVVNENTTAAREQMTKAWT